MLERSGCIVFTLILIFSIMYSGSLISGSDGSELIDVGEGNQIITCTIDEQVVPLLLLTYEYESELVRQNSTFNTRVTFVNLCSNLIEVWLLDLIPDWSEIDEYGNLIGVLHNDHYFISIIEPVGIDKSLKYAEDPYAPETIDMLSISLEIHVPENVSIGIHKFQVELLFSILPENYWPDQGGDAILPQPVTSGPAFEIEVFEKDTDGDGHGDSEDMFPLDPKEYIDSDLDGVGGVADVFDSDPTEWSDEDGDGIGDNMDIFPKDPLEWSDLDGDGTGDNRDAFPKDPSACRDYDGDGHPDYWNPSMGSENSTLGLTLDMYQIDPTRWDYKNEDGGGTSTTPYLVVGLTLVFIEILVILNLSSRKKEEIRSRRLNRK